MINEHPLTDEICRDIDKANHHPWDQFELMRTAADWQLEQVIQFLEANKTLSVETALRFIRPVMRPQSDDGYPKGLGDFVIT